MLTYALVCLIYHPLVVSYAPISLCRENAVLKFLFLTTPVSTNFLKILWEFIQGFFPVQYGANEFVRIQFCLIKSKIRPKLHAFDFLKIFKSSWCWNICWNGQSSFRGLSWKRLNPKHTLKNYTSIVFRHFLPARRHIKSLLIWRKRQKAWKSTQKFWLQNTEVKCCQCRGQYVNFYLFASKESY